MNPSRNHLSVETHEIDAIDDELLMKFSRRAQLAQRIGEIKERVRYLEVRAMLDEVAENTSIPIEPMFMGQLFDHRTSRLQLLST